MVPNYLGKVGRGCFVSVFLLLCYVLAYVLIDWACLSLLSEAISMLSLE